MPLMTFLSYKWLRAKDSVIEEKFGDTLMPARDSSQV